MLKVYCQRMWRGFKARLAKAILRVVLTKLQLRLDEFFKSNLNKLLLTQFVCNLKKELMKKDYI